MLHKYSSVYLRGYSGFNFEQSPSNHRYGSYLYSEGNAKKSLVLGEYQFVKSSCLELTSDIGSVYGSGTERLPNVTNVPKTHWAHNLISFNQVKTF